MFLLPSPSSLLERKINLPKEMEHVGYCLFETMHLSRKATPAITATKTASIFVPRKSATSSHDSFHPSVVSFQDEVMLIFSEGKEDCFLLENKKKQEVEEDMGLNICRTLQQEDRM
jgi:hypothetical protein